MLSISPEPWKKAYLLQPGLLICNLRRLRAWNRQSLKFPTPNRSKKFYVSPFWNCLLKVSLAPSFSLPSWDVWLILFFSQDFQDQVIPGQETKAELSNPPVDSNRKTSLKIRYNSKRRQWRRTKLGLYAFAYTSYHIKMKTSPLSGELDILWEGGRDIIFLFVSLPLY